MNLIFYLNVCGEICLVISEGKFTQSLSANIIAFQESDYYNTGINNVLFVIGKEYDAYKIIQTIILPNEEISYANNEVMLLDCDTPVLTTDSAWHRPIYVNVYRADLGVTEGVDFLYYCKVVTVCEVEEYASEPEAIKAIAVAIKNYAWKRKISPKYGKSELGCDLYDNTRDQVYNPTKYDNDDEASKSVCVNAVLETWNYFMLDYDYRLFVGFHCDRYVAGSSLGSGSAKYHGGVLSQSGARDLAKKGCPWQGILNYYYDYGTYEATQLANGPIRIVKLGHNASISSYSSDATYHWGKCSVCGCSHKEEHTYIPIASSFVKCSVCGKKTYR